MNTHHNATITNSRRAQRAALHSVLLIALTATLSVAYAQYRIDTGRALDANLQMGSGGYNQMGRAGIQKTLYRPDMQAEIYRANKSGEMTYNPNNAFLTPTRYAATRYTGYGPTSKGAARTRYR
jgi:hypothetical protein